MVDKLQVDLVAGNADKATAQVEKFTSALVKSDATAKKLDGGAVFAKDWDKQIAAVERRTLNMAFNLRKLGETTIGTKGVDGIGRAAQRAELEIRSAYSRLRQLEAEAASTRDPVVLKKLQSEAAKTSLELDRLQNKVDRVAAGRSAAAARRPAGSSIDARGLASGAASAGIPFAFEASAGLDAAAAIGIGTASLAVFGALAAAGVGLVKLSEHIRTEAERRLHVEELIAGAANKQIISAREQLKVFRERDAEVAKSFELQRSLAANNDAAALRQRAEFLRKLRDMNPTGPNAQGFDTEAAANETRARQVDAEKTAAADKAFNDRNEQFKKSQEQQREAEKKRIDSINAGRAKIDELGDSTDKLFASLFAKRGQANPFVAVFTEAEAAVESTRIATALLSKDLQKQAADMVAAANANALFSARLETRLQSSDLRGDARRIRNAGDKPFVDPAILKIPGAFEEFANRQFENQSLAGLDSKLNVASLISSLARAKNAPSADQTASERLDAQLKVIRDLRPENDVQRAEADRKIIALTQGLNPADLTDTQRNAAAAARENEATRLDNAEKNAKIERDEQATVQKSIDKNISELLDIAKKDGLTGVIRIINEADDAARTSLGKRKRADAVDARDLMDQ